MKRELLRTPSFTRPARRLAKKSSQKATGLLDTLVALSENAFEPSLKTHKLKGDMAISGLVARDTTCELSSSLWIMETMKLSCFTRSERMTKSIDIWQSRRG